MYGKSIKIQNFKVKLAKNPGGDPPNPPYQDICLVYGITILPSTK